MTANDAPRWENEHAPHSNLDALRAEMDERLGVRVCSTCGQEHYVGIGCGAWAHGQRRAPGETGLDPKQFMELPITREGLVTLLDATLDAYVSLARMEYAPLRGDDVERAEWMATHLRAGLVEHFDALTKGPLRLREALEDIRSTPYGAGEGLSAVHAIADAALAAPDESPVPPPPGALP